MPNKLKYNIGDKIDLLTIIERGPNNGKTTQWYCDCECGAKHQLISTRRLSKKDRKKPCNCGCLNKQQAVELGRSQTKSLVGQVFGKLLVLEATEKRDAEAIVYKCQCSCGVVCEVRSTSLRNGHTQSCGCLKSLGELIIGKILTQNQIPFEKEKTFSNCRYPNTNYPAKFDFFINNTYLIEYDGETHFSANGGWNTQENLQAVQMHDIFKNQWCEKNNIPIIRINKKPNQIKLEDLLLESSRYILTTEGERNE